MEEKYEILIKEAILMEKQIFNNDKIDDCKQYYSFIINNSKLFWEIYSSLNEINSVKIIKFLSKITNKIPNTLNFDDFKIINSKKNLINFLITVLLIKTFSKNSIYDNKKENSLQHLYTIRNTISQRFENILIFLEINFNFKYEIELIKLDDFIVNILFVLIEKKIIIKELIPYNKRKKTFIYIENIKYDNTIILSFDKYKIYEKKNDKYLYSSHFSLVSKIFKKNIKSNYFFKTDTNSKFFENILNTPFYIDKIQLKSIFDELLKENKSKSCQLEQDYEMLKDKLFNFIKKKDMTSISLISSKISKIQNLLKIKSILNIDFENKEVYMPFSLDFRGRFYYSSEISISYYKEFRFCINLGKYNELRSNYHPFNDAINIEIKKYFNVLCDLKNYNFIKKKEEIKISIIWLLISLGEINKTKLGKEVHISKIINEGLKIINKEIPIERLEVYERIKIKYVENIFNEIEKDIYVKWLLSKDATASVYQHLVKTCGHNNNDVLKWCNLKSKDTWYDTYEYILDEFKNKNNMEPRISKLFNRVTLKKIMMTENYSATYNTCKDYFLEKIQIDEYSEEDRDKIFKSFRKFYEYISNNKSMFELDLKEILDYFKKNEYSVYLNNDSKDVIVLKYYKGEVKQKEITIGNTRFTYQSKILNEGKIDTKKIKSSIKANYIHTIDATLARWILAQAKIMAVHDCFFIDYINLTYLVSVINEGMRLNFHNIGEPKKTEIFSLFIVI